MGNKDARDLPFSKQIINPIHSRLTDIQDPDGILITNEQAKQLYKCLSHQYISHEDYPLVHDLLNELSKRIDEHT